MERVRIIPNKSAVTLEKANKLLEFFAKLEQIALRHGFKTNSYSHLVYTNVGECDIAEFDTANKRVEFRFAPFSIYNGQPKDEVIYEMSKFKRLAEEVAQATGYKIDIQEPLYYDENR